MDADPIVHALVSHQVGTTFACAQAGSVRKAEEILKNMVFDVVLVGLSGDDGLHLVRHCRYEIDQPALAIIYLTGSPSHDKLVQALEAGATSFLIKPLPDKLIAAHLEYAIAGARKGGFGSFSYAAAG